MKVTQEYFKFISTLVIQSCNDYYGNDMMLTSPIIRSEDMVKKRRIVWVLIKEAVPTMSLIELANIFQKDHTTVIYSLRKHHDLMQVDKNYRREFNAVYTLFLSKHNFKNTEVDRLNFLSNQIRLLFEERRKIKLKLKQSGKIL